MLIITYVLYFLSFFFFEGKRFYSSSSVCKQYICVTVAVFFSSHSLALIFIFVFVLMIINRFWWFYKWVSEYRVLPSLLLLSLFVLREGGTSKSSKFNEEMLLMNISYQFLVHFINVLNSDLPRIQKKFSHRIVLITTEHSVFACDGVCVYTWFLPLSSLIDKSHKWFSHRIK